MNAPPLSIPIVGVHGVRLSGAAWEPVRAELPEMVALTAPDLPGHGSQRDRTFTLDAAVETTARHIVETTAQGQALVAGHSLGGYVAMALAARHPERVLGLGLAGCATNPVGLWGRPYQAGITLLDAVPAAWLDEATRWLFRRRFPPEIAEAVIGGGLAGEAVRPAVASVVGRDFLGMVRGLSVPTLVINGRRDVPFRIHEAAFCRAIPRCERVVLRGAGHMSLLERPAAIARELARFAQAEAHAVRPKSGADRGCRAS